MKKTKHLELSKKFWLCVEKNRVLQVSMKKPNTLNYPLKKPKHLEPKIYKGRIDGGSY
jgi:hypothetical protein